MLPIDKLQSLDEEFHSLREVISNPANMSDAKAYRLMARRYKELSAILECWHHYSDLEIQLSEAKDMLTGEKDEDIISMAKEEITS